MQDHTDLVLLLSPWKQHRNSAYRGNVVDRWSQVKASIHRLLVDIELFEHAVDEVPRVYLSWSLLNKVKKLLVKLREGKPRLKDMDLPLWLIG